MATAETDAAAGTPAPAPKSRKKLIIIAAIAVVVLAASAGGVSYYLMQKAKAQALAEAEGEEEDAGEKAREDKQAKPKAKDAKPSFMALESFVINLADKDGSRYAQIGIQLELEDDKAKEKIKAYEPIIRSNIIVLLARKTSTELLEHEGKMKLAREIRREVLRPLGYEIPEPPAEAASGASPRKASSAKAAPAEDYPVRGVHFSSFIIQ